MATAFVQSWERLYSSVGVPSADPEEARTIIIATLATFHKNPALMTDEYHIRIPLNVYFSAIRVRHFGDVMTRLRTTLPEELLQYFCVEVIQLAQPPSANVTFHAPIALEESPDRSNR